MSNFNLADLLMRSSQIGDILAEVDSSDRIVYMGFSDAGASEGDPAYRIVKFTYDGDNTTFDSMKHADGSTDQNKVWDDREDYTY